MRCRNDEMLPLHPFCLPRTSRAFAERHAADPSSQGFFTDHLQHSRSPARPISVYFINSRQRDDLDRRCILIPCVCWLSACQVSSKYYQDHPGPADHHCTCAPPLPHHEWPWAPRESNHRGPASCESDPGSHLACLVLGKPSRPTHLVAAGAEQFGEISGWILSSLELGRLQPSALRI